MDEFIDKLEQNDKTFIETLNKNFEEYKKSKQKLSWATREVKPVDRYINESSFKRRYLKFKY